MPDTTRVSLLTFSAAVAVFDLTRSDAVAAHVLPGEGGLDDAVLRGVRDSLPARLAPLSQCRSVALAAIKSLRSAPGTVALLLYASGIPCDGVFGVSAENLH